MSCEAGCRGEE
uniref:Uncharacterized protein n=1 Tax=Anguilla anguilla TaxID=7936 RepID=A0A0E9U539_ANGAN